MSSLESRSYLASPADIEAITRAVLDAQRNGSSGRVSYLRALVENTKQRLSASPTAPRRTQKPDYPVLRKAEQIRALEAVDAEFYSIVVKTARKTLPNATAIERNSRTNFARSAKSTLKSWLLAGNDINTLVPSKVTKKSLQVKAREQRQPSVRVLTKQSNRYSQRFVQVARKLVLVDKAAAKALLDQLFAELSSMRSALEPARKSRRHEGQSRVAAP